MRVAANSNIVYMSHANTGESLDIKYLLRLCFWFTEWPFRYFVRLPFIQTGQPRGPVHMGQEPVCRKSWKRFRPEKPLVKLRPAYSVKLVFSYVVKGIKMKITAKIRASRRLSFEDNKRIISPEMVPKSFGTFEKRAPVHKCNASALPNWESCL